VTFSICVREQYTDDSLLEGTVPEEAAPDND
jgi:hypothetical protein